ncbi:MAG: NAD(P)-dependent oxidoreductase [Chloroflexi bacterium]|nr:NAD(P)-dependent oxidoreductase [Chloroflexota bacterium]MDA1241119.1 NAD(P)-dependent oxidoreductase [Chloroflexota bacterium]MQC19278.1 NAD(P)-dependent oxidoreductase [Chloroflexota bacterium]
MTMNDQTRQITERLNIPRQSVPKQAPEQRVQNFDETYLLMDMGAALIEAARCIDCPSAPCMDACPVHNDIPAALKRLEDGDLMGAAAKFRETSTLPEMCGRLCPQESLCEGACVVGFAIRPDGGMHPPVAIGRLESFITDNERRTIGRFPVRLSVPLTGQSVAIIGSGPAGLTVAEELQARGHSCTIFDMWPEPGGVLRYGIPNFKMSKQILDEKLQSLRDQGITFVNNTKIGTDVTLDQLHNDQKFDVIFIGTGAGVGNPLRVEGEELKNVYPATDFLVRGNLSPEELPSHLREKPFVGTDVVVIGGGDTSMDCVRTAVRLGARQVTCVYRRTEAEMLGRAEERTHAREEGVTFAYLTTPVRFVGDADGNVQGVELVRMELGEPDASGRRRPIQVEGSEYTVSASAVVIAVGYGADAEFAEQAPVETDRWGLVKVNERTGQTNVPYIFAGGDVVNGADLVVTAIADGKRAATWIHQYLSNTSAMSAAKHR